MKRFKLLISAFCLVVTFALACVPTTNVYADGPGDPQNGSPGRPAPPPPPPPPIRGVLWDAIVKALQEILC